LSSVAQPFENVLTWDSFTTSFRCLSNHAYSITD